MKPWKELVESGAVDLLDELDRLKLADVMLDQEAMTLGSEDAWGCFALRLPDGVIYKDGRFYERTDVEGRQDFSDYADCVEYCNQRTVYGDSLEGDWFYADDVNGLIYSGTFGNDHSPGASHYTYCDVYDTREEYQRAKTEWESYPEYDETDDVEEAADEDFSDEWVE